jgi:hypothetical protein
LYGVDLSFCKILISERKPCKTLVINTPQFPKMNKRNKEKKREKKELLELLEPD